MEHNIRTTNNGKPNYKRRNLQTRLEQLRKTTTQTNKIILTQSLYAWKQSIQQYQQGKTTKQHTTN